MRKLINNYIDITCDECGQWIWHNDFYWETYDNMALCESCGELEKNDKT